MEESAEQVLARLELYAAALRLRPPVRPLYRTGTPFVVDAPRVARADTLIPSREHAGAGSWFAAVAVAITIATCTCAAGVVIFARLGAGLTIVAAFPLVLGALMAQVRRVPFAGALTIGLVIAAALVRLS